MKLNIKFLQTGGVPLTNDLMSDVMESIQFYDMLGSLAGHLTIIKGCDVLGSSAKAGVVAINGECYFFEGGLITSTVYIHTEQIFKTFEDQTDKNLIERKSVRFGTSTPDKTFTWNAFFRLETLKEIQDKVNATASDKSLKAIEKRLEVVELKTAPIVNGGVVWIWKLPASKIPDGWKECTDLRGKTVLGRDPNNDLFKEVGKTGGNYEIKLNESQLPKIEIGWVGQEGIGFPDGSGDDKESTHEHSYPRKSKLATIGKGEVINILNPCRIVDFIEPNFQ